MDDFYMNISSQNQSNLTLNNDFFDDGLDSSYFSDDYMWAVPLAFYQIRPSLVMMTYVVIALAVPLTLLAIYSLYTWVSSDHVAPIYVINLLLSDLLQFGLMIIDVKPPADERMYDIIEKFYFYSLLLSVGFMVCVAMERYLVIVHPLWYRCRRTIKSTVVVCVMVWLLPLVYILTSYSEKSVSHIIFAVFLLLPFPLLIYFLVATVKALSASISVSSEEKRRIVGVLVLVLLIYTLLFLPTVIKYLENSSFTILNQVSGVFRKLSPLADLVLYVFMRKGAVDKLLAAVCCC